MPFRIDAKALIELDGNDPTVSTYNLSGAFTGDCYTAKCATAGGAGWDFWEAQSYSGGFDTEFRLRGDGNAYCDGSWNGSGADYQEFFESISGLALEVGRTVVLVGDKVQYADDEPDLPVMGVIRPKAFSKNSMVVGNCAWNHWHAKFVTDDYGRYEMEDYTIVSWKEKDDRRQVYAEDFVPAGVVVPPDAIRTQGRRRKLNPSFDPEADYVPRSDRPEWNLVGLLGQVQIQKGQPTDPRWIKMTDISDDVELWMIR